MCKKMCKNITLDDVINSAFLVYAWQLEVPQKIVFDIASK